MGIKYKVISTSGIITYSDNSTGKKGNNMKNFFLPKVKKNADKDKIYLVLKKIAEVMDKNVENFYIQEKFEIVEEE
ncbi:hypothetical protein [Clostridium sp.]|uniref:DUF1659 domain-containing protein n=1 Tax=Clostridium sp. TaxID=1506 RepID=UPI003F8052EC